MTSIDQLSRDDLKAMQERLSDLGFDPGRIDGIWGPRTGRAYDAYLASRQGVEISVPIVTPAPARPWWRTKRGQGFVTLVVGSAALFIPALREVDTAYLIELIWDNLDHVDAIISAGGALITAGGAIWATIGAARAKAPIDPHLLLPGVRLPDRVRRSGRQAPAQSMSADSERRGYWGDPRGPFDPE
jgi:peptidoglycan hydrolase-like protein with peptidoglycan-binding domain